MVQQNIQLYHRAEIIGHLVSVGVQVPDYVALVVLSTNLNNYWHFFWFQEPKVLCHVHHKWPKHAMTFVKNVVPLFADCAFHVATWPVLGVL